MSQVTPFIMGRNNRISSRQRASLEAFLATGSGQTWLANIPVSDRLIVAKSGFSALGPLGKLYDLDFVARWDRWAASLEVAPPKSHMWSKGALVIALGC
jgi:hypothetical protein